MHAEDPHPAGCINDGGPSSLLVTAPFQNPDRPAAGLNAVVESPLANSLGAAMGARLRARGPLLGPCGAPRDGEQGEQGDKDGYDDKTCHGVRSPRKRGRSK